MPRKPDKTVYNQVLTQFREELATRRYAVGDRLPSVRDLAARHNCSITTIQNALALLRREGVLETKNRQGLFVRAFPSTGTNRGRIICLFPKWDWIEKNSFAAQYLLGVTLAASACGYAVESVPYDSVEEILAMRSRLHRDRYAGILWANPAEIEILAQIEASGIRIVSSIRHHPTLNLPATIDDYQTSYAQAAALLAKRGVRQMGLLCNGLTDATYEPALQILITELKRVGIQVPPGLICRVRTAGLGAEAQAILLRHFLSTPEPWDACWAFSPGIVRSLFNIAQKEAIALDDRTIVVQTICAETVTHAQLIVETNVHAHGREAFRLLHNWIETGHRPENVRIPLLCSEVAKG